MFSLKKTWMLLLFGCLLFWASPFLFFVFVLTTILISVAINIDTI